MERTVNERKGDFVVRLLAEEVKTDYPTIGRWIDKGPFASSFFPCRESWFDDDHFFLSIDEITSLEEYLKRPYPEECYQIQQYPDFSFGPPYRFGPKAKMRDMESYSDKITSRGISGVISPLSSSVSGGCLLSNIPANPERMTLNIDAIHSFLLKDNATKSLKHSVEQLIKESDPLALLLYRNDTRTSLQYSAYWERSIRGRVKERSGYHLGLITYFSTTSMKSMELSEEKLSSLPGFTAIKLGNGVLVSRDGDFISEPRESFAQAWSTAITVLTDERG